MAQLLVLLIIVSPKFKIMSQAFVKESEEQWLHEVGPALQALIVYLSRENNNIRVYEKRNFIDSKDKNEYHEMSNGLTYSKDLAGKWFVV